MEKDKMGQKAKRILELHAEGKTNTEIMRETGYSRAWIDEVINRAGAKQAERGEGKEE